jgi:hypothetical protein
MARPREVVSVVTVTVPAGAPACWVRLPAKLRRLPSVLGDGGGLLAWERLVRSSTVADLTRAEADAVIEFGRSLSTARRAGV